MSTRYKNTETANADAPIQVDSVRIKWHTDDSPDLSYLEQFQDSADEEEREYGKQDQSRLDAYRSGDWYMMGCVAEAVVSRPIGQGSRRLETLTSGGLWGIESDSDESYLRSVEREEIADLAMHLAAFGIETDADALEALVRPTRIHIG